MSRPRSLALGVLSWSADGRWLAAHERASSIRLLERVDADELREALAFDVALPFEALALSDDATWLAAAGAGLLVLWRIEERHGERRIAEVSRGPLPTAPEGIRAELAFAPGAASLAVAVGTQVLLLRLDPEALKLPMEISTLSIRAAGESWDFVLTTPAGALRNRHRPPLDDPIKPLDDLRRILAASLLEASPPLESALQRLRELFVPFGLGISQAMGATGNVLALELEEPLAAYPWELLLTGSEMAPLGVSQGLVRHTPAAATAVLAPAPADGPIHALLLKPQLAGGLDSVADLHLQQLDRLAATLRESGPAQGRIEVLEAPGPRAAISRLFDQRWRLLVLLGEADPEGRLRLDDGFALGAEDVQQLRHLPDMVLLLGDDFRSMAVRLRGVGVQVVVASGWPMETESLCAFFSEFFRVLRSGDPLILAAQMARQYAYSRSRGTAWALEVHGHALWHWPVVGDWHGEPPATPEEGEWLETALSLLQSMALAFHISAITAVNGEKTASVRDMFPEWPSERRAQLAHWMYMSEYVFWGPVRELLFTGEDPIHYRDVRVALDAFGKAMVEVEEWIDGDDEQAARRWRSTVRRLWNAVCLALHRDPQVLEEAARPRTLRLLRAFAATPVDDLLAGRYGRDERVAIVKALHEPKLSNVLVTYFSPFFERFAIDGLSDLALSADYPSYLDRLLSFWKDATVAVFARLPQDSTRSVEMGFTVPPQAVAMVSQRFPRYDIHAVSPGVDLDSRAEREVKWVISRAGYLALIDDLGRIVRKAVATRLARPPRRPRVLWVDDRPDNNVQERERVLARGQLVYELATSTDEGLAAARGSLFDVVISDMGRPGDRRAGYTLLKGLRREGNLVPFVIYSAGRKPEHVDEALRLGALGTTDDHRELSALVLRAVGRSDDVLRRPVGEELLRQYTEWKFPGLGVSDDWNALAARDLQTSRFPTLLDVDSAVDRASAAVDAYARERPDMFLTGTDRVTKSLGFVDIEFRRRHDFEDATLAAFERHSHLVWPDSRRG